MERVPEPKPYGVDVRLLLADYLDYYRADIAAALLDLPVETAQASRVPSGWTPATLANHLLHVERRWFLWGFLAEQVDDPWGDHRQGQKDDPTWVAADRPLADVLADWQAAGQRTRDILATHQLSDRAAVGGRFEPGTEPPDLQWIVAHVLQEYARHAGHLDISIELAKAEG